jgi:predicted nucleic acid-binding Zn ribbon protein
VTNPKDPGKSLLQRLSRKTNFRTKTNSTSKSRDPKLIGDALEEFVDQVGWQQPKALANLHAQFITVVGDETAAHLEIEKFDNGELILRADSTSWATQLKYLTPVLLEKLQAAAPELGIRSVKVLPPAARKSTGAWRVREGKRRS